MALIDWFEVVHTMVQEGQELINVYHALRADAGRDAQEISEAFNDSVMPDIAAIQYVGVANTLITARSLGNPFDFFSRLPTDANGLRAGANFATFNAAAIQFNRTRLDMNNGQKRWFAGVEADNNGAIWTAAFLSDLNDVGLAIMNDWELGGDPGVPVCNYGILQRICDEVDAEGKCIRYRLPETDGEIQFYIPNTGISRSTVRSQVSRKRLV